MSMGCAQAINAAWLTAKMEDHKRPIALAAYVMSIQLANFPGNQLFRTQGTHSSSVACSHVLLANSFRFRCASIQTWANNCCCLRYFWRSRHFDLEAVVPPV